MWEGDATYAIEFVDVTFGNLAVDPDILYGVLRDFDLARVREKAKGHSSTHDTERTGTVPFMASRLLYDEKWHRRTERQYHHELESFVWVVAYMAWAVDDETGEADFSTVLPWMTSDYGECRKEKAGFMSF